MVISQQLLDILVCPETKQPLTLAEPQLLEQINQRVRAGQLVNRLQVKVAEPFDGVLVRQDGALAYGIRGGIPIMLVDEAFSPRP